MSGGYLGVSVFFTLSGYLITTVLLREHADSGAVSMGRFYSRRAKRLLPASLLCIGLVMVARMFGAFDRVETLRRDGLTAILQVFNWARLSGTSSYADLFSDPTGATISPLEHYWSLAIEEQFYLLWPVALIGLIALARRRQQSVTGSIVIVTALFVAVAPIVSGVFGSDATYWATPARLAEILIGASLAAWLSDRTSRAASDPAKSAQGKFASRAPGFVAAVGLASIVALSATMPTGRGPAYHGFLPAFALLSASLIWALQTPGSVRRVLSTLPVVAIGRVSYGVYLYHWPIFVLLRQNGWKLNSWGGFLLAISITAVVATVSYVFIEQPIRKAQWPTARSTALALAGATAIAAVVTLSPVARPFVDIDDGLLDAAAMQPVDSLAPLVAFTEDKAGASPAPSTAQPSSTVRPTAADPSPRDAPTGDTQTRDMPRDIPATSTPIPAAAAFDSTSTLAATAPVRPVRILVVGDSTSAIVAQGLAAWSLENPTFAATSLNWSQGCGFILDGTITSYEAERFVERSQDLLLVDVPAAIEQLRPDVVVLMTTMNDVIDRQWTEAEGSLDPQSPAFRRRMGASYLAMQDSILRLGVQKVVWIIPPTPTAISPYPELNNLTRYAVQHEVIRSVASAAPGSTSAIDLDTWFDRTGAANDDSWRPDGVHLSTESATNLARWYLGPEIVNRVLAPS